MSLEKIVGTIALIFWACVFIFQRNNPGGKNNVYIGIACLIIAFIMLLWPSKKKNSSKSTSVLPGARDNTEITNKQKKNLKTALNDSPTNTIPSCDEIHFQHSSAYKTALFLKWCKKHSEFLPADNYPIYMQRDWGIKYPAQMHRQLFEQGYLIETSLEQKIRNSTVVELKNILKKLNLPVSGKKQELIQRILENCDFDSIIEVIGLPTGYCLSQKALLFLENYKDIIESEREKEFLYLELQTLKGYQEDGVKKYQILGTLDKETCDDCGKMDGKVFLVSDAKSGINFPPFHLGCRCTTVAYYDDEDLSDETRIARDPETGKTYEVPADMSYPKWKKKYFFKKL